MEVPCLAVLQAASGKVGLFPDRLNPWTQGLPTKPRVKASSDVGRAGCRKESRSPVKVKLV